MDTSHPNLQHLPTEEPNAGINDGTPGDSQVIESSVALPGSSSNPSGSGKFALVNVRVFDGFGLRDPGTVIIDGSLIGVDSTDACVVDGRGGVLIPGLIDAHTHVSGVEVLTDLPKYGITTVLDMETFPPTLLRALREHAGRRGLTDFRTAGVAATYHRAGFPPEGNVESAAVAEEWVAERISSGSDYIKIITNVPLHGPDPPPNPKTIDAVAAAARRCGKLSVAHATTLHAYKIAQGAKVNFITHTPLDKAIDRPFADQMAADGRACIPTLTMMEGIAHSINRPAAYAKSRDSVLAMHESGVSILAGTDANKTPLVPVRPVFGDSLHHELELLVDAGMSPVEVLRSATVVPAVKFGLFDRGVIAPGRRADLVLLSDDPTKDIRATRTILQVWCNGIRAA
ncbi:hypothetical protein MMC20_006039 [Loxospora ochrophaea]|nr:hypothetical protein [Loxospora ochrophaea]